MRRKTIFVSRDHTGLLVVGTLALAGGLLVAAVMLLIQFLISPLW